MFQLSIISLSKIEYRDKVDALICPGVEGELTVLTNHAPIITPLKEGKVIVKKDGKEVQVIDIEKGVLEVKREEVVALVTRK